jgi:hypothetical protein
MCPSLPANPSLEQLHKQARDILKAHRDGDIAVCRLLRRLNRFAEQSDQNILKAELALHEAQYALAMDYGFKSWPALIRQAKQSATRAAPTDAAGPPDLRLLLEWESQQQMNWLIRTRLSAGRFGRVVLSADDTGGTSEFEFSEKNTALKIETVTSWSHGGALVELAAPVGASLEFDIGDPYVRDRRTTRAFALSDLASAFGSVQITSQRWPIRNCFLRAATAPAMVERQYAILASLGEDRRANIEALLRLAGQTEEKDHRTCLLLRAAAACTGGCNHGPVGDDGWDWAIRIYQRVIDENPGTDVAINARWAQASCYGCWSPMQGDSFNDCDGNGVGKHDWAKGVELYEELYRTSKDPGSKADALRRKAEVQCYQQKRIMDGLKTYRRIIEEFPTAPPPSPYWTYRTCAPHCGTEALVEDVKKAVRMAAPGIPGPVSDKIKRMLPPTCR